MQHAFDCRFNSRKVSNYVAISYSKMLQLLYISLDEMLAKHILMSDKQFTVKQLLGKVL